ncbi:MAG TPA: VTT domain-containing protein [Bryobacteraceae bacterium]|nr:VTT domain-containing protein [Bryobacteraceae bacterium]
MVHAFIGFLHALTDPVRLAQLLNSFLSGWLGYAMLFGVVYAETGLLAGFFFPGDSLLFTVGAVAGAGDQGAGGLSIGAVIAVLASAALLGDSTGFFLGRKTGARIFSRKDTRLFKQEHVSRTKKFYERHGGKTIVYARFIPIVRTFAAFMAGVMEMPYRRFLPYSVCGGIGWVVLMTTLGYELGSIPVVRRNFDYAILAIVALSLLPPFLEALRARSVRQAD